MLLYVPQQSELIISHMLNSDFYHILMVIHITQKHMLHIYYTYLAHYVPHSPKITFLSLTSISIEMQKIIITTHVWPIPLHGSEMWTLPKQYYKKLEIWKCCVITGY